MNYSPTYALLSIIIPQKLIYHISSLGLREDTKDYHSIMLDTYRHKINSKDFVFSIG